MKNQISETTIEKIYNIFYLLFSIILLIFSSTTTIQKIISSTNSNEKTYWILTEIFLVTIIILYLAAARISLFAWDKITDKITNWVRVYPNFRKWSILPSILFASLISYLIITRFAIDITLKVLLIAYLVFYFPAAIISLIQDDNKTETKLASKNITRELRIKNPQAAIENAFTHFEDHLHKRISADSKLYGNKLIQKAYEGDKSELIYEINGKNHNSNVARLMGGAYSVFRNPRHHSIINDDEDKALAIISLVDLLIDIIDNSKDRI